MNDFDITKDDQHEAIAQIKKGKIRKIVVDKDACIGAGSCVVVTPGVFQLDKENKAYIVDPTTADEDMLMMSAQSCPVLAIHLYDEEGNKIWPNS